LLTPPEALAVYRTRDHGARAEESGVVHCR
jgi:hypothetical protein